MIKGQLRKRMKLQPQSLVELLTKRYKWSDADARQFADFLLPMLDYDPRRRATAEQCLRHAWLQRPEDAPETSSAPGTSCAATDCVEPAPQQHGQVPPAETPADDNVTMETKCDVDAAAAAAPAAETKRDDDVIPNAVDASA